MEDYQQYNHVSNTLEVEYFDYNQYTDRLYYEYRPHEPLIDSCSDISSKASVVESVSNYHADVGNINICTHKPLQHGVQRKINEKQRKARRMHQFRKWLIPKNAISALHELRAPNKPEMIVYPCGEEVKAEVVIDNVKYEAIDRNKNLAKTKASEIALRDLFLGQVTDKKKHITTEDLPIEFLAPFALHKLFTEWKLPGFNGTGNEPRVNTKLPKVAKTIADLPPNAADYNPSLLFSYMRPQVSFEHLGLNGDPNKLEYVAGLRTDGYYFFGTGSSRKLARRAAAIEALKELFGIVYEEE